MNDTSIVKIMDSSMVIENGKDHIILIQDSRKEPEKGWNDNPWVIFLVIPLIVSVLAAAFTHFLGRNKNKREIDKLTVETEKIKNSFQPVVVATIQSVNDKLLDTKIKALINITKIKSEFIDVEQQYYEGDPVFDYDDFLESVFRKFTVEQFNSIKQFKDDFSYFLSKKSFEEFNTLYIKLEELYQSRLTFYSVDDGETDYGMDEEIKLILTLFERVLNEMRNELHLDNTFVEDFIRANQHLES